MDKVQKASDSEWSEPFRECKKETGSLEMLELVVARAREQMTHEMLKPPHESHIAQKKPNFKYSSNRNVFQAALVV
jgi:hypothetical protein